jgi:hypothetical protein
MNAIVAEFGFSTKFPENVENEAKQFSDKISSDEIKKRRDYRKTLTFTIDPLDAKDFDDAISLKDLGNGIYEIGVHIADVSHYVTPKSALDNEAYVRGTSVYLVDRTIPMLPEKLSNGLCSLRPHEEKLTFSAVFKINSNAEVLEEWFGKTVIYSDRRFTYEEAQERIEKLRREIDRHRYAYHVLDTQEISDAALDSLKHELFVEAARSLGASQTRIIFLHLMPNLLSVVLVYLTLTIPRVMLFEAFLSFLGLGVEPPDVSWGLLANEGIKVITPVKIYWWLILFPSIALGTTLLALNFLGDGVRDALDPRLRDG